MSFAQKIIVITGCDDRYLVLANDLLLSLRNLKFRHTFDLGMLDVGLSEPAKEHVRAQGVHIKQVKSDIDFPARALWETQKPALRTLTARPFLRNYFPGYDTYVWLDADVWSQTPDALDHMIDSALKTRAVHLAPELDRCYQPFFRQDGMWQIYHDWYQVNYGNDVAKAMLLMPMLNAGIFAMSKDSPIWDAWAKIYTDVLQTATDCDSRAVMADQLALNIAVYMHKLPCVFMPATFNWLTCFALPYFDRASGLYVEPEIPYRPISQFHLTRPNKLQVEKITCLDGTMVERPLLFSARNL